MTRSASVTLSELNITDGNAASGGGVLNSGTLRVTKCTLTDNSAQLDGGAIDNAGGTLTVANSTLSGNSAEYGGAIYDSGTLKVGGSTLSDNSASMEGGAIATLGIGRGGYSQTLGVAPSPRTPPRASGAARTAPVSSGIGTWACRKGGSSLLGRLLNAAA